MVYVSELNTLDNVRPYIVAIFEGEGRDFTICELCGDFIDDGKFEFHHTKYEGATIRDLLIICRGCNHKSENLHLI